MRQCDNNRRATGGIGVIAAPYDIYVVNSLRESNEVENGREM